MKQKAVLTTIAATAALLAAPVGASAASSVYAPDQNARTFASSAAGWTGSTASSGACVQVVLCPAVTNSYVGSDGAEGDGFIRTAIGSLTGVGGTSSGTWTSPAFVYRGLDGAQPDALGLTLSRRSDVGELLQVAGNTATFTVELVGASAEADSVTIINSRTLGGADNWSKIREVPIKPGQLRLGESYQIEITSTYRTGTTVVPSGNADYDNVVLRARDDAVGTGPPAAGGFDASQLVNSGITGKSATVTQGGRVLVNVRCARKLGAPCKIAVNGLRSKRGGKLGKARHVTVRNGGSRAVVLRIKPKFRAKISARKRIYVREHVRSHGHSLKKVVKLKLRHG